MPVTEVRLVAKQDEFAHGAILPFQIAQFQKKYEEIVKIVNNNNGNDKIIGQLWDTLRYLNRHAISDVIKGNAQINDRVRARISSRFDTIVIKDPTKQPPPTAEVAVV